MITVEFPIGKIVCIRLPEHKDSYNIGNYMMEEDTHYAYFCTSGGTYIFQDFNWVKLTDDEEDDFLCSENEVKSATRIIIE